MACISAVLAHTDREVASSDLATNYVAIPRATPVVAMQQVPFSFKKEDDPHLICEPDDAVTSEIIGRATDSTGKEHVLWKYTRESRGHTETGERFYLQVTTLLAPSVCGISYYPTVDEAITNRIELGAARSLSLQLRQLFIDKAGGLEAYKTEFLETLRQRNLDPYDRVVFTSVDVWIWEQIGLDVPSDQYERIENIDNNYRYDEHGQYGL